jgi:hypothetical protein
MRPRFWILLLAPAIVQVLGDGGTVKYFTDKACKSQAGSGAYTLSGHQDDIYCDNVNGLANIGSIIVTDFNFTCDDPKQPMLKLYNDQDCPTADVDVMALNTCMWLAVPILSVQFWCVDPSTVCISNSFYRTGIDPLLRPLQRVRIYLVILRPLLRPKGRYLQRHHRAQVLLQVQRINMDWLPVVLRPLLPPQGRYLQRHHRAQVLLQVQRIKTDRIPAIRSH